MEDKFEVKDSGERINYQSGMRRDTQKGKPNYRLIDLGFLKRLAIHLTKGAKKYGRDNWRMANSQEELDRFEDSSFRHLMQYLNGEEDEDHGMAVVFNIMAAEWVKDKLKKDEPDQRWTKVKNVFSPKAKDIAPEFVFNHDPETEPQIISIKPNPLQITLELIERLNRVSWPDGEVSVRVNNRFIIFDVVWPTYKLSRRFDYLDIKSVRDPESIIIEIEDTIRQAFKFHDKTKPE
jgi:hypothetical protein